MVGGQGATTLLETALHDASLGITARLAAARELTELHWQPRTEEDSTWLAIVSKRWEDLLAMAPAQRPVLFDVLDQTLYSPRDKFDGNQLSDVSIPAIKTLGQMSDPRGVTYLMQAVRLTYDPDLDESRAPGVDFSDSINYLKVVATRQEAATALGAMGESALSASSTLTDVLRETKLHPGIVDAVAAALKKIQPD